MADDSVKALKNRIRELEDKLEKSAEMEEALFKSEERYKTLVENAFNPIYLRRRNKFEYVNPRFCETTGYTSDELTSVDFNFESLLTNESKQIIDERRMARLRGETVQNIYEIQIRHKSGRLIDIEQSTVVIDYRGFSAVLGIMRDISLQKDIAREKEKLIKDLQDALSRIKVLTGLLPICAYCKKIRDDKGNWSQMETYISERTDADFTHGICPGCFEKYKPRKE